MSCEICGRSSCTRSFHTLEAQERYDERMKMSDDVDDLRVALQDAYEEIKRLELEINDLTATP